MALAKWTKNPLFSTPGFRGTHSRSSRPGAFSKVMLSAAYLRHFSHQTALKANALTVAFDPVPAALQPHPCMEERSGSGQKQGSGQRQQTAKANQDETVLFLNANSPARNATTLKHQVCTLTRGNRQTHLHRDAKEHTPNKNAAPKGTASCIFHMLGRLTAIGRGTNKLLDDRSDDARRRRYGRLRGSRSAAFLHRDRARSAKLSGRMLSPASPFRCLPAVSHCRHAGSCGNRTATASWCKKRRIDGHPLLGQNVGFGR